MICPKCGTENGQRSVCQHCGTFLATSTKKQRRPLTPEEKKAQRIQYCRHFIKELLRSFGVLIIAFLLLTLIFYLSYRFIFSKWDALDSWANSSEPSAISTETDSNYAPKPTLPQGK